VSAGSAQPAPLGLADPPPVVARLARALAVAPDVDPIAERILDGALAQFCDTGLTGSTMDDVARRAGLARVTIYRRFENKNSLIEAVLLRECRRWLGGLLRVEPQVILPFMTVRAELGHAVVRGFLAYHLGRARDAGQLAALDVEPIAELMTRITTSFLLSPASCIPCESDEDMRAFARRYLVPLVNQP
jgi:AcrR family transcriptional regulator